MNRKDFIKVCSLLGISIPAMGLISSCTSQEKDQNSNQSSKNNTEVLIIGAGAAGLSAAYLLKKQGIGVKILEAKEDFGGRMMVDKSFTDFPLNYGAEWLSNEGWQKDELQKIADKPDAELNNKLFNDFPDQKFYKYSWYDFFKDYIINNLKNDIEYKAIVSQIDYHGEKVKATTENGTVYTAEKLIVTTPPSVLKSKKIAFLPALPKNKLDALDKLNCWGGFRAYVKLKAAIGCDWEEVAYNLHGQKIYYNASYKQDSSNHIVGVIAIGSYADAYHLNQQDLKNHILKELDAKYNNKATPNFLDLTYHNWDKDPYALGSYVSDFQPSTDFENLNNHIDNKLFFAGDSYTNGKQYGKVHIAAQSAKIAVAEILEIS